MPLFFLAHEDQHPLIVDFSSSVANLRSCAFRKSISAQDQTHSGGFELTKLTYTRLEEITSYVTGAVSDIGPVAPVV